jgi:putative glycerol-1-phosphate prenyltransferase
LKNILYNIASKKGQIAILIDPDKSNTEETLLPLIEKASFAAVNFFFIGGSTVSSKDFNRTIEIIKENTTIPVIIFPGGAHMVSDKADGLLFLSLISGRNPDFLIGHHVQAAKEVFDMDIEVIPTGYLLIDGGSSSSVAYVSQTSPIPSENESIILNTVKAGILTGKELIFMDAGSGASKTVDENVVRKVAELGKPLIVGGGINSPEQLEAYRKAGANIIVIGNKLEEDIDFLLDINNYIKKNNG